MSDKLLFVTGADHLWRCSHMLSTWGVRITGDQYDGKPKAFWREKVREDSALNNVFYGLARWDSLSAHLVNRPVHVDGDGHLRERPWAASMSEALSALKMAIKFWAGAMPLLSKRYVPQDAARRIISGASAYSVHVRSTGPAGDSTTLPFHNLDLATAQAHALVTLMTRREPHVTVGGDVWTLLNDEPYEWTI